MLPSRSSESLKAAASPALILLILGLGRQRGAVLLRWPEAIPVFEQDRVLDANYSAERFAPEY